MKALVLEEYSKLVYKEMPFPRSAKTKCWFRSRPAASVHGMDGSTGRRQPPLIMGDEASGVMLPRRART